MRLLASLLLVIPAAAQIGVPGAQFTYPSGQPAACSSVSGFPAPALCSVPGELPLGSFPLPAPGGAYIDPNFGATVRVLTPGGLNYHPYSSPTALSTNGKYALVTLNSTTTAILDTASGTPVRQMFRKARTWSSGEIVWDVTSDNILYYVSFFWNGQRYVGDRLMRYDVAANLETLVQDYTKPPYNFSWIARGGTGDMSKDGWLPFYTQDSVCVVQVATARTICSSHVNVGGMGWTMIDFVSITKGPDRSSGKHYVMIQGQPANAIYEFDAAAGTLNFQFRPEMPYALMGNSNGNGICEPGENCIGQAHSDTFEDWQGNQYFLRAVQLRNPCSWVLSSFRFNAGTSIAKGVSDGGGRTDVALLAKCGGGAAWPALHVGCARKSSFCSISLENRPLLPSPVRDSAPYNSEIWVMRDNGLEIRRLAMHRSVIQTYYDQPRVCLSDDGRKALWDTNFGVANARRVVVADTNMISFMIRMFQ
jgi:hypothetical protein